MTGGAFSVFLLHMGGEQQYQKMNPVENEDDMFTLEQISSGDSGEDGFSEEVWA
jgi:hypothetical protein